MKIAQVSASGAGDSRERVRRYNADYTFDSACQSTEPSYASQEKVCCFEFKISLLYGRTTFN